MPESPWAELTCDQVVVQFTDYLTSEEQREIIDFELDGEDTLGMVCATLVDKGLDCDQVLERIGATVVIPGPSE